MRLNLKTQPTKKSMMRWVLSIAFSGLVVSHINFLKSLGETRELSNEISRVISSVEPVKKMGRSCLDPNGPQPIILMSLGRSGSTSTFEILGNLTGMETPCDEYTGKNGERTAKFFKSIPPDDGGQWVVRKLCSEQRQYPNAGIVGFKWKPNKWIHSSAALAGLDFILHASDPAIKIIRLKRNPLDVFLSRKKHDASKIPAHCNRGDDECMCKHYKAGTNMTISTKELLSSLQKNRATQNDVDNLLLERGIPHVQVSYERLYHGQDTDEWTKVFQFLGVGPMKGLTKQRLDGAMTLVATSASSHQGVISNFEEVKRALTQENFESLLRS